jgi:hypothetical protein
MRKSSFAIVTIFLIMCASSATAQVARVFLAGSGNDLNDCSDITTPCRSLQGAVDQCPVKGEVIIIASGGFGTASITKSITVDAAPGVLAFNARTITVTIGPTDIVTLRGLTMNGSIFGDSAGVVFIAGGTLNLENCDIGGFANYGVIQETAGNLNLKGCAIHDTDYGVYSSPASAGNAKLVFAKSSIRNTLLIGLLANARTVASVTDSQFANNGTAIEAFSIIAAAKGIVSVDNCTISGSNTTALAVFATTNGIATIYVTNTSINSNNNTLTISTSTGGVASVVSFGDNSVANNTTTTLFSSTVPTT